MPAARGRDGRTRYPAVGETSLSPSLTHSLSACFGSGPQAPLALLAFSLLSFLFFLSGALGKNNDPARSSPVYLAGCPAYLRESGRGQPVLSTVGFRPGGVGTTRRESERGGRFLRR